VEAGEQEAKSFNFDVHQMNGEKFLLNAIGLCGLKLK
jgi:hypothetical protein